MKDLAETIKSFALAQKLISGYHRKRNGGTRGIGKPRPRCHRCQFQVLLAFMPYLRVAGASFETYNVYISIPMDSVLGQCQAATPVLSGSSSLPFIYGL